MNTNQPTTAARAIDQSIRQNEIVHIPHDQYEYDLLCRECDDMAEDKNAGTAEFLGTRGEHEWRVHMDSSKTGE